MSIIYFSLSLSSVYPSLSMFFYRTWEIMASWLNGFQFIVALSETFLHYNTPLSLSYCSSVKSSRSVTLIYLAWNVSCQCYIIQDLYFFSLCVREILNSPVLIMGDNLLRVLKVSSFLKFFVHRIISILL